MEGKDIISRTFPNKTSGISDFIQKFKAMGRRALTTSWLHATVYSFST